VRLSIPLAADPAGKTRTIGRNPEQADLVIAHKSISSLHAGIRVTDRGVELCDLGSSNGTRVDGKRIGRDYVSIDGAKRISLGACELTASRS
jgi:pSer/pThr/pTyr-binding forkhead associated (FHA) protein